MSVTARRRMQGRLATLSLIAVTAAALTAACDVPANWADDSSAAATADDSSDYSQVCTDRNGDRVSEDKCAAAPADYESDSFDSADTYLWLYVATRSWTSPPYGSRVVGVLRTPTVVVINNGGAGSSRPVRVQRATAPGTSTPTGGKSGSTQTTGTNQGGTTKSTGGSSSGTISRGGFGVSGGGSTGTGGGKATGSGGTSSGS